MDYEKGTYQDEVDYKGISLPIGTARVKGQIEDFAITVYDRTGNSFSFQVVGGNICTCNNEDAGKTVEYEVR